MSVKIHGPELMGDAEKIVKPQYPTAVQVENIGTSSLGLAGKAEEIDQWKFVFTDIDGSEIISIEYANGSFSKAERERRPWIKTQIKELPRNMPLNLAFSYLRNAGYNDKIKTVILRAPFPAEKAASYVFQTETRTIYLDALGGEVIRVVEEK
ncbi:MAG: hypothetical protein EHM14_02710 [Methanothrix sp.]|nr:MAG: hypothetical protein EHM14_02710 [Methanothrix sp.]